MITRSRSWQATQSATPPRTAIERIAYRNAIIASNQEKATATVAALGSRAPLIYGRVQTKGLIGSVQAVQFEGGYYLTMLAVWGEGEITAIEELVAAGETSNIERSDYLGTATQGVDPWLAATVPGYADTLRGTFNQRAIAIAYSVLKIQSTDNFPSAPTAVIRGLKLYDPRTGLRAYSTNPALILADVLVRAGETVDWAACLPAISYCDEMVGTQPRWTCSLVINSPADVYEHVEMLRAYAHCLIDHTATGIRLVPDNPAAASRALTATDVLAGSLTLNRPARRETPTYVRVGFTDTAPPAGTTGGPWGTAYATAAHTGLATNDVPWTESALTLAGIQDYQEASRSAIERLNAYTLRNLYAECVVRDEGLTIAVGDVITLTHSLGLSAKPMRVLSVNDDMPGRYKLSLEEYDPAVYSNAIVSTPTYPNTQLPSPFVVPAPINLAAAAERFRRLDGTYATCLRLSWDNASYPYGHHFSARVLQGNNLVWSTYGPDSDALTTEVSPGTNYEIRVCTVANVGITSPWTILNYGVPVGNFPPTDITALWAVEVGGEVRLSWPAAYDTDIWRYEIRCGAVAGTWDTARLIDRVDGLRLQTRDVQPGPWRFWIKALDAVGQYSTNAAYTDVVVTLDDNQFFVGSYTTNIAAGAVNIYSNTDRFGQMTAWSEKSAVTVNTLWPNVANTYTNLACSYSTGASSSLTTTTWDIGTAGSADAYSGTLTADLSSIIAMSGTITTTLQASLDNTNWTNFTNNPIKATLAYARINVAAATGNGLLLRIAPTLRLDINATEESGRVTTNASGAKTVTLANSYSAVKALILSPGLSSVPLTAVYDNIVLGTPSRFDIWLFDGNGSQLAGDVSWRFLGV